MDCAYFVLFFQSCSELFGRPLYKYFASAIGGGGGGGGKERLVTVVDFPCARGISLAVT